MKARCSAAGFYLIDAPDLDEALAFASGIPSGPTRWSGRGAAGGGAVPLLEQTFREAGARLLAHLVGFLGAFDLTEEAC